MRCGDPCSQLMLSTRRKRTPRIGRQLLWLVVGSPAAALLATSSSIPRPGVQHPKPEQEAGGHRLAQGGLGSIAIGPQWMELLGKTCGTREDDCNFRAIRAH